MVDLVTNRRMVLPGWLVRIPQAIFHSPLQHLSLASVLASSTVRVTTGFPVCGEH